MNKQTMSASRGEHKKTARRNAAKLLGSLVGFELSLIMLFWLLLIVVTPASFYDSDIFIPWKPLLQIMMAASFFILSASGCYYIAYRFQLLPLKYLDDVADAARLLAVPTDAPVSLPADLKTPLTSVLGYLKLLEDEPDISAE